MTAAITGVVGALLAATIGLLGASKADLVTVTVGPQPTTTVTTSVPGPTVTLTETAPPTDNPTEGSGSNSVRRTSGDRPIVLTSGYGVDLDDKSSPNWLAHSGPAGSSARKGSDISWGYGGLDPFLSFNVDTARVSGSDYGTCASETGYSSDDIPWEDLNKGDKLCVRTDRNRYAFIKIMRLDKTAIAFNAIVWDPPFER